MSIPVPFDFWPAIELLASEQGLTLCEVASLARVPQHRVQEDARRPYPSMVIVHALMDALGCDEDELIEAVELVRGPPPTLH